MLAELREEPPPEQHPDRLRMLETMEPIHEMFRTEPQFVALMRRMFSREQYRPNASLLLEDPFILATP